MQVRTLRESTGIDVLNCVSPVDAEEASNATY